MGFPGFCQRPWYIKLTLSSEAGLIDNLDEA